MDRSERDHWLHLPETQEFLRDLAETFPQRWQVTDNWDHLNRLKGHSDVFSFIEEWCK